MKKTALIVIIAASLIFFYFYGKKESPVDVTPPEVPQGEISGALSEFGFDLFLSLVEEENGENVIISPYSVHAALLLAYNGAEGETREEMKKTLYLFDTEIEDINSQSLSLINYLEHRREGVEMSIANALFLKDGIPFIKEYTTRAKEGFRAEIDSLPLTGELVNKWVEEKTNGKIEDIIDPGPIDADVIAYLVNALYFKGDWKVEFDKEKTEDALFYGEEDAYEVKMMEIKDDFYYLENDDLQMIVLPYKDNNFIMRVILPGDGLSSVYEKLSTEEFNEMDSKSKVSEVTLYLPRFTLDYDIRLSGVLKKLGISEAFHPQYADFGGMVDLSLAYGNVYMSEVFHKTFVEVNEEGTEAAAATAVEMRMESAVLDPIVMQVDRPFIFTIEEKETGTLIFIGQVNNPTE